MPWTAADAKSHTKKADTPEKRKKWAKVANSAREQCIEGGGEAEECDARAIRIANAALDKKGRSMDKIMEIIEQLTQAIKRELGIERKWDGAAANYDSTEEYCSACLIDVNAAAGRDEKAQSHCMLPVKRPGSDSYDFEGIMAAAGGRGIGRVKKPDDVPEDDWSAAVRKAANTIISQYGKNDREAPDSVYEAAGKEPPERAIGTYRLHEQFYALLRQEGDEWPRVVDIYLDDDGMYGLVASGGKLYRYPLDIVEDDLQITDERQQVMELHQPMTEERSITVHRQADGRARWTAVACTAILNRVGEIDSTTLFDNMIRRAEEGKYPYLTFWHQGEALEMGHADFLARDGVVYIASGLFSEDELGEGAARGIEADPDYWGTSNKFKPCGDPEMAEVAPSVRIPVYRDGEHIEISILPEHKAAAWFTSTGVGEEVTRMRKEIADALRKLLGDENAEKWIDRVDGINRQADEEGMITREDGDQPDPQDTPPADGKATVELDDKAVGAIIRALGESDEFAGIIKPLFEVVERLGSQVEELAKKLDEASAKSTEGMVQVRERLNTLERDEEEKWRERLEDLPSRHVTRVTYKPRVANDPANGGGRPPNLADVAESTLSKIPTYGRRQ